MQALTSGRGPSSGAPGHLRSEINVEIRWFLDSGFTVRLGDQMNGFLAEETLARVASSMPWLQEAMAHFYPSIRCIHRGRMRDFGKGLNARLFTRRRQGRNAVGRGSLSEKDVVTGVAPFVFRPIRSPDTLPIGQNPIHRDERMSNQRIFLRKQLSRRELGRMALGGALGATLLGLPRSAYATVRPQPPGIKLGSAAPCQSHR